MVSIHSSKRKNPAGIQPDVSPSPRFQFPRGFLTLPIGTTDGVVIFINHPTIKVRIFTI